MAKNSIPDYSATAASNTDIQSVNIDEGCAPSGINNAIRELMVDLKNMDTGTVALTSPQMTSVDINGGTVDGVTLGTSSAVTEAQVDNININGNTVSSTNTNGDVNLSPNGTGTVVINTDLDVDNININGNTIISTDTNGNIALTPNGTGEVDISKVDIDSGAIDGTTIGASSAAAITGTTITGTSFVTSGDMTFGDNDKAIFGAGSDLQIYHSGSDSFIKDVGTGDLWIQADNNLYIGNNAADVGIQFASNGAASLYYDNAVKLATTSGGIDVTGTATTDGLTVAGNVSVDGGTIKLDGNYPTGTGNVALGNTALDAITSGTYNTAIGSESLTDLTTGTFNVGVGDGSLGNTTTASYNTALGASSLLLNTTGAQNTAVGQNSLRNNTTASNNTAVGYQAGYSNTTAASNTFVGHDTGYSVTTGSLNTFIGKDAGYYVTTGTKNTIIGKYNGNSGGLDIRTSSNYIVLSDGDGNPRQVIDSSGNVLVGKTVQSIGTVGVTVVSGQVTATADGADAIRLNRKSSDGSIIDLRKDGTTFGSIASNGGAMDIIATSSILTLEQNDTAERRINFQSTDFAPRNADDDTMDLGKAAGRWDDVYATNGTIQTSDANEKQDIEALSDAEQRVAVAAKGLLRKYRWKSSVAEKGDEARIHFGIIAQDLKAAFEAEGLDAGRYAMFINSEWWEHSVDVPAVEADPENDIEAADAYTRVDTYSTQEEAPEGAVKRSRMGVRYNQLLAFIIAAI